MSEIEFNKLYSSHPLVREYLRYIYELEESKTVVKEEVEKILSGDKLE
jgi:hypothetical protein